jgi:hypothetical protein
MVFNVTFNTTVYFSYIVAVRFIGGGNRRIRRKPPGAKCSISLPHICGFVLYIYCYFFITNIIICVGVVDLQLPVQSVPITTKVMSSNPVYDDVYLIQHYIDK